MNSNLEDNVVIYHPKLANINPDASPNSFGSSSSNGKGSFSESFEQAYLTAHRYRYLILFISIGVILTTIFYAYLATPQYTAQAILKVDQISSLIISKDDDIPNNTSTPQGDQVITFLNLLTSLPVIDQALSNPTLSDRLGNYFSSFNNLNKNNKSISLLSPSNSDQKSIYRHSLETLLAYKNIINAQQIKKTNLIRLKITTSDPELSALIANAHVESFIKTIAEQRQGSASQALDFLNKESEELTKKLSEAERKMAAFAEQNGIVTVQKDEHIVTKRLSVLNQLLIEATEKRIKTETKLREAVLNKENNPDLAENQVISDLKMALRNAETEHATLGAKFQPEYPHMKAASAKVKALRAELNRQYDIAVKVLEAESKANIQAEKEIGQQLELQKSKAFELARRLGPYKIMEREYDSLFKLHESVLEKLKEGQIAAESNLTNISLIEPATIGILSAPKKLQLILVALVVGPLVGYGLAIFLNSLDNTIQSPEESEALLSLPTLGIIPLFSAENSYGQAPAIPTLIELHSTKNQNASLATAINDNTTPIKLPTTSTFFDSPVVMQSAYSLESEAFRTIRTSIILSSADNPLKTLLVTSAQKGEGKSTMITNLAVAFAQSGSKTVLIDADLRRPTLHTTMSISEHAPGLVSYLTNQATLEDIIYKDAFDHLDIITAGPLPPNPAELIGSKRMAEFLLTLRNDYDYVLIDTPPVLPVTDALLLSRLVDGVLLVIRGQSTPKKIASRATATLRQARAKIVGVILNKIDQKSSYYHYYRDVYSYYRSGAA